LKVPAVLGKAEWLEFEDQEKLDYENGALKIGVGARWNAFDQREFDATIHMFRHTDSAMCCVFDHPPEDGECNDCVYVYPKQSNKKLTPQTEFDLRTKQRWTDLRFGPWCPAFLETHWKL
jgi:hypothetical protein